MINKRAKSRARKPTTTRKIVRDVLQSTAEHKYYTVQVALGAASSNAGTILALTQGLIEGDTIENRSGRQIQHMESHLRISVNLPALALTGSIRFIWVADNMNVGTTPTVAQILDSANVTSPYALSAVSNKQFTILSDRIYSMVVGGSNQHITPVFTSKNKRKILFSGSANLSASNGRGSHFVLIITDAAANTPGYTIDYDLHYLDV